MKTAKLSFTSEEEIKQYVDLCESEYYAQVKEALDFSASGGKIITLCGPTCSGKTTTAMILDGEFLKIGKQLHTISIDDFYFDRETLFLRSKNTGKPLDYDSPSTIDIELFAKVIDDIEDGGRVTLPKFDFKCGKRIGYEEITVTDGDVFLFEGIQAVYPELTRYLASHKYTSLFISAREGVRYGETEFEPRELRLLRRLVRDERTRGADAQFTLSLWESVCANEDAHIYPNIGGCHMHIDSSFAYEVSVIKPFVTPLLCGVPTESKYKGTADKLLEKLSYVPIIDAKFVPDASVFREFIGERI